jgi:hypothetical protein
MTSQTDDQVPDDVPEGDYVEQHQLADGSQDDNSQAVPLIDDDAEADPADVQEQSTPAPVDDDDRR